MMRVCAVRDAAVDSFGQPIFVPALGAAIRSFMDEINAPGSEFGKHPKDYDLYHIGDYEPEFGVLTPIEAKLICAGREVQVQVAP